MEPMGIVPPLLILQTMRAVNWRVTDIAKESHEDNVQVATVSVIPMHSEECSSVAAAHTSPDQSSFLLKLPTPPRLSLWGFPFLLTVKATVLCFESSV